ncbi:MAG: type IX secretion system outer membrane channel protein PorV [Flavobacteriales bacterium]|nr:type IX secretion system outer membrane channel protein PorV [Flavobacteriales bacterium]
MMNKKTSGLAGLALIVASQGMAQTQSSRAEQVQLNTITTAVPFLQIGPDSRSGAMGDAGVAISPDANAIHWNAAKLAFADNEMEFSMSYSPWLRNLVPDINLAYLAGYKKLDKKSAVGAALRYFSLGNITFTDQNGSVIRDYVPNEFSLDGTYSRKLSDRFSMAMSARFIYSNLTGGVIVQGANTKAGKSVAVDVSGYYTNPDVKLGDMDADLGLGFNISNIGAKMNYTNTAQRDFLPCNMRLGTALSLNPDEYNKITFAFDVNKLLVPTPPIYELDSLGSVVYDADGNPSILSGRDPNVGVAAGIFGSFNDAPGTFVYDNSGNPVYDANGQAQIEKGSKFKEELREFTLSPGIEWWYAKQFAARAGYFHEHASKGNRKYFTIGAGIKYSVFSLDLSYLISISQQNPLNRTLRFSLRFSFESLKKDKDKGVD